MKRIDEVNEYRVQSAEWLEYIIVNKRNRPSSIVRKNTFFVVANAPFKDFEDWQPNQDANQMLMVWKKLSSKVVKEIFDDYLFGHPILTATMRVFMEHINSEK